MKMVAMLLASVLLVYWTTLNGIVDFRKNSGCSVSISQMSTALASPKILPTCTLKSSAQDRFPSDIGHGLKMGMRLLPGSLSLGNGKVSLLKEIKALFVNKKIP